MKIVSYPRFARTSHRSRRPVHPRARGMTLLELTVVILVLLSLISVLFIGANAWKKGSDRTLCIMNLQNVQKGVRSFSNLNGYSAGATVTNLESQVIGLGRFVEKMPECPGDGTYASGGNVIPNIGTLYINCTLAATDLHAPASAADW